MNLTTAPSFDRARKMSHIVSWLSSAVMWLSAAGVVAGTVAMLFFFDLLRDTLLPEVTQALKQENIPHADEVMATIVGLGFGRRTVLAAILIATVTPTLFVLFQLRTLFAHFAVGQLFTDENIARLRLIGLGLVISVVVSGLGQFAIGYALGVGDPDLDFKFGPLFYGAIAYVAAYVMGEGRRIADDNAGIV